LKLSLRTLVSGSIPNGTGSLSLLQSQYCESAALLAHPSVTQGQTSTFNTFDAANV
jgi:hypothetical protein